MSQFPTSPISYNTSSLEQLVSQAKAKGGSSQSINVKIPNLVRDKYFRQDALVYSSIQIISEGTDSLGNDLGTSGTSAYALPAPLDIIDMHSANYEGIPLGQRGSILEEGKGLFSAYAEGKFAGIEAGYTEEQFISQFFGQQETTNVLTVSNRISIDPNIELAYRGPILRQIQFQYRLVILNPKDADLIYDLISRLRELIYPSQDNVFTTGYPAFFIVKVLTIGTGQEEVWSNRILFSMGNRNSSIAGREMKAGCVLTDMQVSYGENGTYGGHYDGSPGIVNLNLTFQENTLSTRESIQQEYS